MKSTLNEALQYRDKRNDRLLQEWLLILNCNFVKLFLVFLHKKSLLNVNKM